MIHHLLGWTFWFYWVPMCLIQFLVYWDQFIFYPIFIKFTKLLYIISSYFYQVHQTALYNHPLRFLNESTYHTRQKIWFKFLFTLYITMWEVLRKQHIVYFTTNKSYFQINVSVYLSTYCFLKHVRYFWELPPILFCSRWGTQILFCLDAGTTITR